MTGGHQQQQQHRAMGPLALLAALVVAAALPPAARAGHFHTDCLYFSHQQQNEVMIYRPDASVLPPSQPYGKIYPDPNPTGLAYYKDTIYVAAYGDLRNVKPSIRKYSVRTRLPQGYFADGPEIQACFPEGLAVYEPFLVVGCGAGPHGVLKYDIKTGTYLGPLAGPFPAVFGVTVKNDYVYFASHCTSDLVNGQAWCSKEEHDKVFRVPILGSPEDVTPFAALPNEPTLGFTGLRFGPDGNLYVASRTQWDVYSFDPFGNPLQKLNLRRTERASDVIFDSDGRVRARRERGADRGGASAWPLTRAAEEGGRACAWAQGYVGNPGHGEIDMFSIHDTKPVEDFCQPGPDIVDSKITYLLWAPCPHIDIHDEL